MLLNPIEFFSQYIEKETGIVYAENNTYQLKMRLEEICRSEGVPSIEVLARMFQSSMASPVLKQKLLDTSTNNETLFFRDPKCFSAMETFLTTKMMKGDLKEIRVWSAAASTGQEALSVAILLEELFLKGVLPDYKITATDISDRAISKCKAGLYTDFEVSRGLPPVMKEKYFRREGDQWRVSPSIHSKIKFGYNNLIRSTVYDKFHLILCRNVLIYQRVEKKKEVLDNLYLQLENEGAIILGAGETTVGLKDDLSSEMVDGVSFYVKHLGVKKSVA